MDPVRKDGWPLGANNVARPDRLPEGAVRELINLDPSEGGILSLRAGYTKVMPCTEGKAAFAVGDHVVVVDGPDVVSFTPRTGDRSALGTVNAAAAVSGAALNGELYLSTPVDSLRTDGATMKPWAVPAPGFQLEVAPGGTLSGLYRFAVVATGADGEESGADPVSVTVPEGSLVRVLSDDPRAMRVYASAVNGATLFYQGLLYGGGVALSSVRDDTEYLTTVGLSPMPHCEGLVAHHGVLVGRAGKHVFVSAPMRPHLFDPIAGFFQYPDRVRLVASTDGGVYIVADKTYFLRGVESAEPTQRVVLELDAVEGTAVALPDGRVAWFTRHGQAIGSANGEVQLVNRRTFAPDVAERGAAGVVGYNGNEMVVTTMRGATSTNNLATSDFADLEIG